MGYTTDFDGYFTLDEPLTEAQATYLNKFSETRRMKRLTAENRDNLDELKPRWAHINYEAPTTPVDEMLDPVREAVGLPVGTDGGYFVGAGGHAGQDRDDSIIDYNEPPCGQPGLWCQWIVRDDDDGAFTIIEWDGGEKFYHYVEWLEYIIEHFLKPWGRTLNGEVHWAGEEPGDLGKIVVEDNVVTAKQGRVVYD